MVPIFSAVILDSVQRTEGMGKEHAMRLEFSPSHLSQNYLICISSLVTAAESLCLFVCLFFVSPRRSSVEADDSLLHLLDFWLSAKLKPINAPSMIFIRADDARLDPSTRVP